METAYGRCKEDHRESLNRIYQLRIEACQLLNLPEEAKKTALAGAKHFQEIGRFDRSVAWLYDYCVTKVLGQGQEQEALGLCDAYMASLRDWQPYYDQWFHLSAKREELLARLAGKPVPDMSGLRFVNGTKANGLKWTRMAATDGTLWFMSHQCYGDCQPAMMHRRGQDGASELPGTAESRVRGRGERTRSFLAAWGASTNSTRTAIYSNNTPMTRMRFQATTSPKSAKEAARSFSPSKARRNTELRYWIPQPRRFPCCLPQAMKQRRIPNPRAEQAVCGGMRSRRDSMPAPTSRYDNEVSLLRRQFGWSPSDNKWQQYPTRNAPRFGLTDRDETLLVRVLGNQTEFQFLKAGKKIQATVPVPQLMGDPAFDDDRIWVPTSSGLYEIDRATGRITWLAYDDGNWFLSVLKAGDRLYVATSRGLYYREISLAQVKE